MVVGVGVFQRNKVVHTWRPKRKESICLGGEVFHVPRGETRRKTRKRRITLFASHRPKDLLTNLKRMGKERQIEDNLLLPWENFNLARNHCLYFETKALENMNTSVRNAREDVPTVQLPSPK
mmetsp:Transcript_20822/g.57863  ORF Transcript_20822/g.57863 Transcript_20822/m.57863 type:complete len:122 (-) Transcript_20822:235-600(-)